MTEVFLGQAKTFLKESHRSRATLGVIGDVALDVYIQGSVDRISPEAPVPVLQVERSFEKLGCAANVVENLLALAKSFQLGVEIIGLVGRDEAGQKIRQHLASRDAALKCHWLEDPSRPTIQKTRFLAGSQHQLLRVDYEKTHPLDSEIENLLIEKIEGASSRVQGWIVQDYSKGLLSPRVMQKLLTAAKKHKIPVFVDPHRNTPPEFYRGVTLLTPNVAESESLLGRTLHKGQDNEEIAAACLEIKDKLQLEMVLLTRSQYGMTLLDGKNQIHHFPAISRAVFDVTGAGDTVVAVFGASLLCGASLEVAGSLATAAASVVVAKVGTATASPDEILAELDHFPK